MLQICRKYKYVQGLSNLHWVHLPNVQLNLSKFNDANHTVDAFAKLLRDLKKPPILSSHALLDRCGMILLYEAMLQMKEVYLSSLPEPLEKFIFAKPLP